MNRYLQTRLFDKILCIIRKTIKRNNSNYTLYDNTNKTFYDTYSYKLEIIVSLRCGEILCLAIG